MSHVRCGTAGGYPVRALACRLLALLPHLLRVPPVPPRRRALTMKIRALRSRAPLLALVVMGCSGRVNTDTADGGGAPQGGAGTGGVIASAGGQTNSGASAGRLNAGGTAAGGGSSGAAGAGGNGAGGAVCPATPPDVGSPCPQALTRNCSYGGSCGCGLVLFCDGNGRWELLPTGCACPPPPPPHLDAGPPIACGAQMCPPDEVCVQPAYNPCGPQPPCVRELDGGACPSGTMRAQFCGGSSSGGCVAIPKPAAPHCAPMPSSCGANPSCGCLPSDICGPNGIDVCSAVRDRQVECLCTAP